MQAQKIDLKEVDREILGTSEERKSPKQQQQEEERKSKSA